MKNIILNNGVEMPILGFDVYQIDNAKECEQSTHEGSGMGSSERDIKKLCQNAKVMYGLGIRGGSVKRGESTIKSWIS